MLTTQIYELVLLNNGIKSIDIAEHLKIPLSTTDGILSMLKARNIITDRDGKWHMTTETPSVHSIKLRLLDINADDLNMAWSEGYLSALADYHTINEDEFDILLDWLKTMKD